MASQNIIESINIKGHKIEIYQDASSKFRWRAIKNNENVGSSEQGFKNLEQCKSNLNNLADIMRDTVTSGSNVSATKVEIVRPGNDEKEQTKRQSADIDWNIFWLMAIILILSLFIFAKIFIFR
jgi:uncharacterized protein YegP (UPF0339 family)